MITAASPSLLSALPDGLTAGAFSLELLAAKDVDAPEWIKIAPRGEVTTRDRRFFVIDPERLVSAFKADGTRPCVDIGHNTEYGQFNDVPPPAIGWVEEMEAREDGLYARIDWLEAGKAALATRGYRYVSPCFFRESDEVTARLIKSVAICTSPALGGLPSLNSSDPVGELPMLKDILVALGLPPAAPPAEALSAIAALKDPTKFVPIEQHQATASALSAAQAELKSIKDAGVEAKCAALIDQAVKDGKVAPAAKDHYLKLARADYDAAAAALAAMPALLSAGESEETKKLPGAAGASALTAEQAEIARSLGISEADFAKELAAS